MKETIKALREKQNLSQNTVANYLGISRQMYIKYENEDIDPPVRIIVALAELYNVTNDVIIQNQLCPNKKNEFYTQPANYNSYKHTEQEIADKKPIYKASLPTDKTDLVLQLVPDLPYEGLLKVLGKVSGLLQKQFYQKQAEEIAQQNEVLPKKKRFNGELTNSKTPEEREEARKWFEETTKFIESQPPAEKYVDWEQEYKEHLRRKYEGLH